MGQLVAGKHVKYISSVEKDSFESVVREHLRTNGAYWGLATLDILGKLDNVETVLFYASLFFSKHSTRLDKISVGKTVDYIVSCKNLHGGFGCSPGGESHAGQIFCYVGALAIAGALHHFNKINFVKEHFGGCPHFDLIEFLMLLVVASLKLGYDRQSLLDQPSLSVRTLKMGISDRPDDAVDVFHHILEWQD